LPFRDPRAPVKATQARSASEVCSLRESVPSTSGEAYRRPIPSWPLTLWGSLSSCRGTGFPAPPLLRLAARSHEGDGKRALQSLDLQEVRRFFLRSAGPSGLCHLVAGTTFRLPRRFGDQLDARLSGPNIHALPRNRHRRSGPGVSAPHDRDPNFHFHYALGFSTQTLAGMLDSLVRVTRRVD